MLKEPSLVNIVFLQQNIDYVKNDLSDSLLVYEIDPIILDNSYSKKIASFT